MRIGQQQSWSYHYHSVARRAPWKEGTTGVHQGSFLKAAPYLGFPQGEWNFPGECPPGERPSVLGAHCCLLTMPVSTLSCGAPSPAAPGNREEAPLPSGVLLTAKLYHISYQKTWLGGPAPSPGDSQLATLFPFPCNQGAIRCYLPFIMHRRTES